MEYSAILRSMKASALVKASVMGRVVQQLMLAISNKLAILGVPQAPLRRVSEDSGSGTSKRRTNTLLYTDSGAASFAGSGSTSFY